MYSWSNNNHDNNNDDDEYIYIQTNKQTNK